MPENDLEVRKTRAKQVIIIQLIKLLPDAGNFCDLCSILLSSCLCALSLVLTATFCHHRLRQQRHEENPGEKLFALVMSPHG